MHFWGFCQRFRLPSLFLPLLCQISLPSYSGYDQKREHHGSSCISSREYPAVFLSSLLFSYLSLPAIFPFFSPSRFIGASRVSRPFPCSLFLFLVRSKEDIVFEQQKMVTILSPSFSPRFPFYYEIKTILVVWLLSPATKGSSILYRRFVHPALIRREAEIDDALARATEQGYTAVLHLGTKGVNYATTVLMQTAIKVSSKLSKPFKNPSIQRCSNKKKRWDRSSCMFDDDKTIDINWSHKS